MRLEMNQSIVKEILEEYQVNNWCTKLRKNLKLHKEV